MIEVLFMIFIIKMKYSLPGTLSIVLYRPFLVVSSFSFNEREKMWMLLLLLTKEWIKFFKCIFFCPMYTINKKIYFFNYNLLSSFRHLFSLQFLMNKVFLIGNLFMSILISPKCFYHKYLLTRVYLPSSESGSLPSKSMILNAWTIS